MKNVLVVVDMQNDFVEGALKNDIGDQVVRNVVREIKSNYYDYLFLTRDCHLESYLDSLEGKNLPIRHCIVGSKGWETNKDVLAALKESGLPYSICEKNGFGTFKVNEILEQNQNELESITLLGLCTDICVVTMGLILRAKFPNVPMFVVEEACGGTSHEAHSAAMKVLKNCQIFKK